MQRYFVKEIDLANKAAIITGQDVHHIRNVMRLRPGDNVTVNTYDGLVYVAMIVKVEKNEVRLELKEELLANYRPLNLVLGMALIKKDKFELAIQKATELGVKAILPIKTENSIIKITDFTNKKLRYELIAKEASEQSERTLLPEILSPVELDEIDFSGFDNVICCYERADGSQRLSEIVKKIPHQSKVLVIIGPEGGFSDREIADLLEKGITVVSLGNTILRAETAAMYVLSAFRLIWEN